MSAEPNDPLLNRLTDGNNDGQGAEIGGGVARQSNEKMWRALAGEHLPDMLTSRQAAENYLQDSDWRLRLAAISILWFVWKPIRELAVNCERMAEEDPNPQVRGTALFTLACCFENTNDTRIGMLLARTVLDKTLPDSIREAAYLGLFHLRGIPFSQMPRAGKFKFADGVDWAFVDSFHVDEPSLS